MSRLIKKFPSGSLLQFDAGKFDNWCVYLQRPGQEREPVTDIRVLSDLHVLGASIGSTVLYRRFIQVYEQTDTTLRDAVLTQITQFAGSYSQESEDIDRVLTTLYAGMIAEENKDRAILKKRIKRLGVHQVLIEDRTPRFASLFSRGLKADVLKVECEVRGF